MPKKTDRPTSNAEAMTYTSVRRPNLREQLRRAARQGKDAEPVTTEATAETVEIQTTSGTAAKKGGK